MWREAGCHIEGFERDSMRRSRRETNCARRAQTVEGKIKRRGKSLPQQGGIDIPIPGDSKSRERRSARVVRRGNKPGLRLRATIQGKQSRGAGVDTVGGKKKSKPSSNDKT